jgi:hypothetical protein
MVERRCQLLIKRRHRVDGCCWILADVEEDRDRLLQDANQKLVQAVDKLDRPVRQQRIARSLDVAVRVGHEQIMAIAIFVQKCRSFVRRSRISAGPSLYWHSMSSPWSRRDLYA